MVVCFVSKEELFLIKREKFHSRNVDFLSSERLFVKARFQEESLFPSLLPINTRINRKLRATKLFNKHLA